MLLYYRNINIILQQKAPKIHGLHSINLWDAFLPLGQCWIQGAGYVPRGTFPSRKNFWFYVHYCSRGAIPTRKCSSRSCRYPSQRKMSTFNTVLEYIRPTISQNIRNESCFWLQATKICYFSTEYYSDEVVWETCYSSSVRWD